MSRTMLWTAKSSISSSLAQGRRAVFWPVSYTHLDVYKRQDGEISNAKQGDNTMNFELDIATSQTVIVTFIFDKKFYVSKKVIIQ